MNEGQQLLKIIEDVKDIKLNTSNNNILLCKVINRIEAQDKYKNRIQLEMIKEFEHIFKSGKNIFEISDLFTELKDKYIKRQGD